MDVCAADDYRVWPFFDLEDAMQRMLGALTPLVVARQIENFRLVRPYEISTHRDAAGRIIVADPLQAWQISLCDSTGHDSSHCQRPSLKAALQTGHTLGSGGLRFVL